jgi:hypothetical protein
MLAGAGIAAAAVSVTACGDDENAGDSPSAQTAPANPSPPPETTAPAPPPPAGGASGRKAPASVAPKRQRLERAGYRVIVSGVEGVEPRPAGALEFPLKGGGQVTVFAYTSPTDAKAKAAEFQRLARRYPDFYGVVVKGTTTYVGSAEEPDRLDRAGFAKAVAAAERE